ncbi:MAG: hypothetical protein GX162_07930 [Firmicutes bacterium]|nr:hypothetical protein [Bacillota bacterium]
MESRLGDIETRVRRLMRCAPITAASVERVKFDTQRRRILKISGVGCHNRTSCSDMKSGNICLMK